MLKQQQQPGSGGRKASNGTSGPAGMSSPVSGINNANRAPAGRNRSSAKPSFQSSPVFEGVYNNARMLHFLTAVVGSTCDIRVKNGSAFEGIFKTLSSKCELAVDAVHKRNDEEGSTSAPPRREDITDTMIFSPSDLVTMICRDVDLNYATRDTFTDTAISSSRINGEHKEKVLQRWDGGDSNGESYDLETDASNGWDANEMFRYNEVKYGVTSTYDSSLSMYTVPLERGNSENYRQREARAARLAQEIESSPQYRSRVNLENDEGRTEEDKFSAVARDGNDRERGRESPRDKERERGRDSPGASNREGKYIPLPQRQREMNRERAERGSGGPPSHNRLSGGYRSNPPSSSSPKPPLPSAAGPQPGVTPSERSSPLSGRVGAYAAHHPQGNASPSPGSGPATPCTPASPGGPSSSSASASTAPSPASPPAPHGHTVPHSHSLPHSLSDTSRPVNGVAARTSPKAQRPPQSSRTSRTQNSHAQSTATRSPKSGSSQDTPYLDTSSVSLPAQKTSGPAPLFPVDVNEILGAAAKERAGESPSTTEESKTSKAPSVQQRSHIEELRKFGKEFRLPPSGASSSSPSSPAAGTTPPAVSEVSQPSAANPAPTDAHPPSESKPQPAAPSSSQTQPSPAVSEDPSKDTAATLGTTTAAATAPLSDRQSPATPQPARTPGSEEVRSEAAERTEGVADQVKKSTLNPNAKEFNPIKPQMPMTKPNTAPTPPRPTPQSPVVLQHPGGQGPLYSPQPYLSSYISQIHSVPPPQMYQYTMSTVGQGKYPRAKGSVVAQRSDHGSSAPPMLQAASAAGAPLVASPYPQSYLQYNPQQYGQQQVIQAMTPYPGQPMYSMLQGGARMIGQGGGPHPQALGPPGGPQFSAQGDGPQGPQQGIYAPQSFSHHTGAVHQPQPSSTPTGNQPPPQHTAPSPGQNAQSGPQPQSLYHSGPLSAPTPPNMPPGHTSPQGSYSIPGYSIHGHQGIPPTYPLGQIAQAHVQGAISGPHHSGSHGQPQIVMLQPQQGPGAVPQHPQHGPQQGAHQHFYIQQAMQVQTHPASFHPPGN